MQSAGSQPSRRGELLGSNRFSFILLASPSRRRSPMVVAFIWVFLEKNEYFLLKAYISENIPSSFMIFQRFYM